MRVGFTATTHQDYVVRLKQSIRTDGHNVLDLPKHESDPCFKECLLSCDIVVVWGVAKAKRLQTMGAKNVLIMERGYLGDRTNWVSLGWDDLNGQAKFYNQYVAADRWDKYWRGEMRPWKNTGDVVLISGQVITDQSLNDCTDYIAWLNDTIAALSTNHHVVFRPHPLEESGYDGLVDVEFSKHKDFMQDLNRAKCLVAWSSTTSVLAAYNGVPSCVFSKYAMTNEVSSNDFNTSYKPDRYDWGRKLAYCQWNLDELSNGVAWYHLKTRFYY